MTAEEVAALVKRLRQIPRTTTYKAAEALEAQQARIATLSARLETEVRARHPFSYATGFPGPCPTGCPKDHKHAKEITVHCDCEFTVEAENMAEAEEAHAVHVALRSGE